MLSISELITKLEKIEDIANEKAREEINTLIEELIAIDLKLNQKFIDEIKKDEKSLNETILKDGIDSGIIGEA